MAAKRPSIQFYPGDWRKDPSVNTLSLAARGLWFEMLLLMHEASARGHLEMTPERLARAVGATPREVKQLLTEMNEAKTYSIENGVIFNRRMVKDEEISQIRSAAGQNGASSRWPIGKKVDSKTDGKTVAKNNFAIVLPSTGERTNEEEGEFEVENQKGAPEQIAEEDIPQVRRWLYEFMEEQWPEPDPILCENVLGSARGDLSALQRFLQQLHRQGRKPSGSWAWFIPVVRRHFEGLQNGK